MSSQYDLVVDGNELGGGSIRIHNRTMQERVFEVLGISKEDAAAALRRAAGRARIRRAAGGRHRDRHGPD